MARIVMIFLAICSDLFGGNRREISFENAGLIYQQTNQNKSLCKRNLLFFQGTLRRLIELGGFFTK